MEYLYKQPSNRALAALRNCEVASASVAEGSDSQIWWELVLCLIRNILCHEHYFDFRLAYTFFVMIFFLSNDIFFHFRSCAELLTRCIECFGSVDHLHQLIRHYCILVLQHNPIARSLHELNSDSGTCVHMCA